MAKKQQWLVKATYQEASEWVLDRDLDDAHYWYVKWDRLEVQWFGVLFWESCGL